jgi:hypothetical protein
VIVPMVHVDHAWKFFQGIIAFGIHTRVIAGVRPLEAFLRVMLTVEHDLGFGEQGWHDHETMLEEMLVLRGCQVRHAGSP